MPGLVHKGGAVFCTILRVIWPKEVNVWRLIERMWHLDLVWVGS